MVPSDVPECVPCGIRHIRCDQGHPACSQCIGADRECTYVWQIGPPIYQLFGQHGSLADNIEPIQEVGDAWSGAFGRVHKVRLTKEGTRAWLGNDAPTGVAAVKTLYEYKSGPQKHLKYTLREAWTWAGLRHRNITPFWGITDYKNLYPIAPSQACMISPWSQYGNVMEFFKKGGETHLKLPFLLDIVRGLHYLHHTGPHPIIHGDLKGDNILVAKDPGSPFPIAQLCDFGLSRMAFEEDADITSSSNTFKGNHRWLAWERMDPERYGMPRSSATMTVASDVFELMRTTLEILTGAHPYCGQDQWQVQRAIMNEEHPVRPEMSTPYLNELMWIMMEDCWSMNRAARYDCTTIQTIVEFVIVLEAYATPVLDHEPFLRAYVRREIDIPDLHAKWKMIKPTYVRRRLPRAPPWDINFEEDDMKARSPTHLSRLVLLAGWKSLQLTSASLEVLQAHLDGLGETAVHLRHLVLRWTPFPEDPEPTSKFLHLDSEYARFVQTLAMDNVVLDWDGLCLEDLRVLEIRRCPEDKRPSLNQLRAFFRSSPNLRRLVMVEVEPATGSRGSPNQLRPQVLEELEFLHLEDMSSEWLDLVCPIRLPALKDLSLASLLDGPLQSIRRCTLPCLQQLTLSSLRCSGATVRALLAALPTVRLLTLHAMDGLLEILIDDDKKASADTLLLPKLRVLRVIAYPCFVLDSFARGRIRVSKAFRKILHDTRPFSSPEWSWYSSHHEEARHRLQSLINYTTVEGHPDIIKPQNTYPHDHIDSRMKALQFSYQLTSPARL